LSKLNRNVIIVKIDIKVTLRILWGICRFALLKHPPHFLFFIILANYQRVYQQKKNSKNRFRFIYHEQAKKNCQLK